MKTLTLIFVLLFLMLFSQVTLDPAHDQRGDLEQSKKSVTQIESDLGLKLTAYRWKFLRSAEPSDEGYSYQFFSNGTFGWTAIADYSEAGSGLWNYQKISEVEGLLFLLWQKGRRNVGSDLKPNGEALYFNFSADNQLQLAGDVLKPVKSSGAAENRQRVMKLPEIINEANFPDYFRIVDRRWKQSGSTDEGFIPESYLFGRDGTFLAQYRSGRCQHGGKWSLGQQLILEVASNDCDLRGHRNAFTWVQTYRFETERLILNQKYIYRQSR
jgi:hypothetical protein